MSCGGSYVGRRDGLEVMKARAIGASRSDWLALRSESTNHACRDRPAAVRRLHYRRVAEAVLAWSMTTGRLHDPTPHMDRGHPRARANVCRKYLRSKIDFLTERKGATAALLPPPSTNDWPVPRWHTKTPDAVCRLTRDLLRDRLVQRSSLLRQPPASARPGLACWRASSAGRAGGRGPASSWLMRSQ